MQKIPIALSVEKLGDPNWLCRCEATRLANPMLLSYEITYEITQTEWLLE